MAGYLLIDLSVYKTDEVFRSIRTVDSADRENILKWRRLTTKVETKTSAIVS